jgi:3-oxoacyl-(acyl-carrier-protein) synthase/pimeloyl-ACP methyl ester carboxylesterase
MSRRVVVTGIGVVAPNGIGVEQFWRGSVSGESRLRPEPMMAELGLKSRVYCPIEEFDLSDYHDPETVAELLRLSRFVQLSVTATALACRDGGLLKSVFDPDRAGVVFSSAIGGTPEFQKAYEASSDFGKTLPRPFPEDSSFYDSVFLNYTAAWTSRRFGLRGSSTTLTTGCTAGIDSLGLAFEQIRHGDLDMAVAAAGEAPLSGLAYATLDVIGSLAVVDGPPETASRPFDATRGGFVLGEGAAAVILEDYDSARARGARIYAEVSGFASANNAFHMSDLAPDGLAMGAAIARALEDADMPAEEIDYVNAHGSSTPQNDVFETEALKLVLGEENARRIPVSSTKSMIGHSLSSASLVGTIAAIGAIRYSVVPPTANLRTPDPRCDLDYVPHTAREHAVRNALVTASGFGGIHSCAVLSRVGAARDGWWHPSQAPARTVRGRTLPGSGATILTSGAPGDGPDVLLLHGFAGTAEHWKPLMHSLSTRARAHLIAVDLPGHGTNALPVDGGPGGTRAFLLDALDHCGASEVIVLGHSFGGLLALDLAAHAVRVTSAVVIGAGLPAQLNPGVVKQVVTGELDEELLAAGLRTERAGAREAVLAGFRTVRLPDPGANVWGMVGSDMAAMLARVTVPVDLLVPAEDRVVSPRKGRALAAALARGTTTVLEQADHYVILDDPDLLAGLLVPLLAGRPGRANGVLRGGPAAGGPGPDPARAAAALPGTGLLARRTGA